MIPTSQDPWYKQGLSFKCTGCGKCCTGAPGYVWITEEEMKEMADYLQISFEQFFYTYVRQVGDRFSLREDAKTYDCVFLNGKQCRVYTARPIQCRTFPWWQRNLASKEAWEEAAEFCEGINAPEAPHFPQSEIEKQLDNLEP